MIHVAANLAAGEVDLPSQTSESSRNSTHVGLFNTILPRQWWSQSSLSHAVRNPLSLYHGEKKLIEKLNAGKGIVTVVYGASNMEDGGWYGTTGIKHKSRAPLDFWGVFMEGIQRRWPKTSVEMASGHGHVLLNLARVGTSLDNLFERSCSQSIYPNNVDLVFIDPHTVPSSDHTLRYLVRQLLALPSPPAIAIITNVNSLQTNYGQRYKHVDSSRSNRAYDLMMLCISLGQPISKLKEQEAACNELGDRVFPNSTDDYQELREGYHQVAKDYGLAHIDLYQLLEVLIRENTKRLSVNEWALFASIYRDILHFNGLKDQVEINEEFGGGSRLLADTLLKWLDETRDRVNQLAKASDKSLEQSICYDVDLDKGQERCERLGQHICPYFSYQQQVDEIHRSIPDFKLDDLPLQVTRMEGFELRHYYKG